MSRWTGVVTNAGAELLNEWAWGGTLRIAGAASGDKTVPEAALLAQSDVSGTRRKAAVAGYRKISNGTQIRLQVSASQEEGYPLRQLGVWAALDGGTAVLLALFQNREGVPIPSEEDSKDFVYTFYGAVAMDNTGDFEVLVDTSAIVSLETLRDEIDALKLELMTNTLTLPLATDAGDPLLTSSGTPLLATYHPNQAAAALAAVEALEGRMEAADTAVRAYADNAGRKAVTQANAYIAGKVLDLTSEINAAKAEAITAAGTDAAAKVATAKAEAVSAAGTVTDAKIAAHNDAPASHPLFLRAAENTGLAAPDPGGVFQNGDLDGPQTIPDP